MPTKSQNEAPDLTKEIAEIESAVAGKWGLEDKTAAVAKKLVFSSVAAADVSIAAKSAYLQALSCTKTASVLGRYKKLAHGVKVPKPRIARPAQSRLIKFPSMVQFVDDDGKSYEGVLGNRGKNSVRVHAVHLPASGKVLPKKNVKVHDGTDWRPLNEVEKQLAGKTATRILDADADLEKVDEKSGYSEPLRLFDTHPNRRFKEGDKVVFAGGLDGPDAMSIVGTVIGHVAEDRLMVRWPTHVAQTDVDDVVQLGETVFGAVNGEEGLPEDIEKDSQKVAARGIKAGATKIHYKPDQIYSNYLKSGADAIMATEATKSGADAGAHEKAAGLHDKAAELARSMGSQPAYAFHMQEAAKHRGIVQKAAPRSAAVNPWAVCTESVGQDNCGKFKQCVQEVKDKQGGTVTAGAHFEKAVPATDLPTFDGDDEEYTPEGPKDLFAAKARFADDVQLENIVPATESEIPSAEDGLDHKDKGPEAWTDGGLANPADAKEAAKQIAASKSTEGYLKSLPAPLSRKARIEIAAHLNRMGYPEKAMVVASPAYPFAMPKS